MRTISLSKTGLNKLKSHHKELKHSDASDSIKPFSPGEWIFLNGMDQYWFGFINPLIDEKYSCIQVLGEVAKSDLLNFKPESYIKLMLEKAFERRMIFKNYSEGCRLVYGAVDGLPGLIADTFKNIAIIQINTAGIDKHRDFISSVISNLIQGKAYLLDNPKYREKESLPTFENEALPELSISENDLIYILRKEVLQKVGFYYDHRENRNQLVNLLSKLNRKFENGIDLFCYAGAWGLNALKAGVTSVDFVDQGDFGVEIDTGLKNNKFLGRGQYFRQDVFKYLDTALASKKAYDLILCDPPAFAKSLQQKDQALDGYSKLHRKVFKLAKPGALIAFSSCTHYVSHSEFEKNINDAAAKENKKIQLLYCGIQGWDHPISKMDDRSNYIKSYFYLTE